MELLEGLAPLMQFLPEPRRDVQVFGWKDFLQALADNEKLALETEVIRDAAKADRSEHTMSLKEAFRVHKKAIFWSMALSAALIMEGYDVVVIGSYYGQGEFLLR